MLVLSMLLCVLVFACTKGITDGHYFDCKIKFHCRILPNLHILVENMAQQQKTKTSWVSGLYLFHFTPVADVVLIECTCGRTIAYIVQGGVTTCTLGLPLHIL